MRGMEHFVPCGSRKTMDSGVVTLTQLYVGPHHTIRSLIIVLERHAPRVFYFLIIQTEVCYLFMARDLNNLFNEHSSVCALSECHIHTHSGLNGGIWNEY